VKHDEEKTNESDMRWEEVNHKRGSTGNIKDRKWRNENRI
jgi:hypothetical protein